MIHLKQPLVLSAQSNVGSPLFASPSSAAASCQQRRGTGRRNRRWLMLKRISCSSTEESLSVSSVTVDRPMTVTATVTVQPPLGVVYAARGLDDLGDLFGKTLLLELVSSELDPSEFSNLNSHADADVSLSNSALICWKRSTCSRFSTVSETAQL